MADQTSVLMGCGREYGEFAETPVIITHVPQKSVKKMSYENWRPSIGRPRTTDRIPVVLEALRQVWEANPDMRLGQLILNLYSSECQLSGSPMWHVEDDRVMEAMVKWSPLCDAQAKKDSTPESDKAKP